MAVFFWLAATLAQIAAHASGERERERERDQFLCMLISVPKPYRFDILKMYNEELKTVVHGVDVERDKPFLS